MRWSRCGPAPGSGWQRAPGDDAGACAWGVGALCAPRTIAGGSGPFEGPENNDLCDAAAMPATRICLRPAVLLAAGAVAGCIIHDSNMGASGAAVGGDLIPASDLKPRRQAGAAAHRRIGTALMSHHLADRPLRALVAREFDSLTPENEMKWDALEPRPGAFAFEAADRLVNFAGENGIRMRGHTLVWHQQHPCWV